MKNSETLLLFSLNLYYNQTMEDTFSSATLSVINNLTDGLLLFGFDKKLVFLNPEAEKFLDIKKEDVLNKSISELANFPSLKPIVDLVGEEIKKISRSEVFIHKDLILEISTVLVAGAGNLMILHDVTRDKLIERTKNEFVTVAAHQLRTPLSAMKWALQTLLEGDLGEITPGQRDAINKAYQSTGKMISLVGGLLSVAKIEDGRYLYKPVLSDFEEIVQSVVESYKEEIEKSKVILNFQKPQEKLPQILVDIEKIKLVIQNLIDNAVYYTLVGGTITISLTSVGKEVEFSIKDSGVGIPLDQQSRIFSKFFRADNAVKLQTEGSGLGLFIVKNIVENHGGKIWFESEENKGSTFYFRLPANEEFEKFITEF